ncbi:MAG: GAK system CofD-like protein [Thermodesulfobacteriota bacterium]|nr:GAK system CofD-like protein [Thermodesulfobacteriota bacterium]
MARYAHYPELGPRILFFSGGSALRQLSREIIQYTHNSIHIITTFDSGGSSAVLRKAFGMPAIGDIRNRLMSLADRTLHGNPAIFELFSYRFPENEDNKKLRGLLHQMIKGKNRLVADIPDPMRKIIRNSLHHFRSQMPEDFDLRRASIGNLVLAGGYLNSQRHLDPVIFIFSKLVQVRGTVRPVVNANLHLVARLFNGTLVKEQHNLTGKAVPSILSPVQEIFLSKQIRNPRPSKVPVREKTKKLIADAELICYPMGSFYSSLIATLLPQGIGKAIHDNPCPKVFIPNTCPDPELFGTSINDQVDILIRYLCRDDPTVIKKGNMLDMIIVDQKNGRYDGTLDKRKLKAMGITLIDSRLISRESTPYIDEKLLIPLLLTLA